jgi:hypothetical protein
MATVRLEDCMLRMVCCWSIFVVTLATGQTTWAEAGSQENTGPLPSPPPSAAPFVESAPFVAFKRIEDQNGSVRIAFRASALPARKSNCVTSL